MESNIEEMNNDMEDLVLSIPIQDKALIETLAQRMGWTMRNRRTSVERFINSCPKTPQMTDEEALIIEAIDKHWEELNRLIDDVFAGKKIQIKRIK